MTTLNAKIVVGAVVDGARKALGDLKRGATDAFGAIAKADAKAPFGRTRAGVESISNQLGQLRTAALAAFGVQGLRSLADTVDGYASLSARLKLVTSGTQEYTTAQRELSAIANRNQVGLGETVQLYTRLAPAVKQLGGSQQQVLQVTEAVALSLRISGATAAESSSAILQFSQAMGAGALRGEEFNAIAEASPRLMQALADGLGKTRGELRGLAEQGKLTAGVVGNALIRQLANLQAEVGQLPVTIGGSLTRVRNAFQEFLGQSAATGTLARGIAEGFNLIAANIDKAAVALLAIGAAWVGAKVGLWVASLTGVAVAIAGPAGVVVAVVALTAALLTLGRVREKLADLREDELGARRNALGAEVDRAIAQGGADQAELEAMLEKLSLLDQEILRRRTLRDQAAEAQREANRAAVLSGKALSEGTAPFAGGVAAFKGYYDQRLELQKDALAREQALDEERYRAGETDARSYFARRNELAQRAFAVEEQLIRREIAARAKVNAENQRRLDTLAKDDPKREQFAEAVRGGQTEVAQLQARLVTLGRDRADSQRRTAADTEREADALERALRAIDQQAKQATGRESAADIQSRVADQFADQRRTEFDATGDTRIVDALVARTVAQERLNQLTRDYQLLQDQRADKEERLRQQLEQGVITQGQFNTEVARLRSEGLPATEALLAQMEQLAQALGPEAVAAVQRYRTAVAGLKPVADSLKRDFGGALQSGLTSFFTDLITGAKSAKEAFADMAKLILAEIARIVAAKLAAKAVAMVFHGGGVVGSSHGSRRQIDPAAFSLAPRFHSGGVVGLRSNEVPAILERGEEVLTRADPRHRANGGGAANISVGITVNGGNGPEGELRRAGLDLAQAVRPVIDQWAQENSRPGGLLWSAA
ncbi:tape measure protein [Arenimonas sp.]|uniref:tape measure protein n=1 Tax=Arenimonas sp. TaxID=1872635 RepID=UPI0025C0C927|nr:tape measure protein [Arenimonas sp.]